MFSVSSVAAPDFVRFAAERVKRRKVLSRIQVIQLAL
jgi:hypothetical protein